MPRNHHRNLLRDAVANHVTEASQGDAEPATGFTLEAFALKIVCAMELLTILNHCHRHRGFVYQHARFGSDKKSIEVDVRPRKGTQAVCSGCHQRAPGYAGEIKSAAEPDAVLRLRGRFTNSGTVEIEMYRRSGRLPLPSEADSVQRSQESMKIMT
jgi:hypothetical protein